MLKPDARQLQALARLARSSDGEVLQELLASELRQVMDMLVDASPQVVERLQGRARLVKEVLAVLREAPEQAAKAR